jgi:hypothetical protein
MKAADVVEVLGIGTPGFFGLARRATEAAVLVGQKAAQDLVGRGQTVGTGETQLAGEAILKGALETFDAAFGLRFFRNLLPHAASEDHQRVPRQRP